MLQSRVISEASFTFVSMRGFMVYVDWLRNCVNTAMTTCVVLVRIHGGGDYGDVI